MVGQRVIAIDQIVLGVGMLLVTASSWAHHSGSMFESEREITLTGVVKEFQFTNPHTWLLVDVEQDDGTLVTWGFENEAPSALIREGIRYSDLPPGTRVTVTARPLKDGRTGGHWERIVRDDDGRIITRQVSSGPGAPPIRADN